MAGEPARWPAPWHPPNDIAPWRIFVAVDASEDKKAEKPKVGYAIGVYCLPGTNDDTPVLPGGTALGPWAECEDAPTLLYAWVQRLPPRYGYDPPNNTVAEGLAACGAFDMFAEGTPISVWSDAQIWHTAWKRLIEDGPEKPRRWHMRHAQQLIVERMRAHLVDSQALHEAGNTPLGRARAAAAALPTRPAAAQALGLIQADQVLFDSLHAATHGRWDLVDSSVGPMGAGGYLSWLRAHQRNREGIKDPLIRQLQPAPPIALANGHL